MDGNFELLGPLEMLQLISQGNHTGALRVEGGEIFMVDGQAVHAHHAGGLRGKQALFQILSLEGSWFKFDQGRTSEVRTLDGPLEMYLLQAVQFIDVKISIGPFDLLELTNQEQATHLTLANEDFEVLKHLKNPIAMLDLARLTNLTLEQASLSVARLTRVGLLAVHKRTPKAVRLKVILLEHKGHEVQVEQEIYAAWRQHFGGFKNIIVRSQAGDFQTPITTVPHQGARIGFTKDALLAAGLELGSDVLVWPAL